MDKIIVGTYEVLASEYYDSMRHPTCANFRQASNLILKKWIEHFINRNGTICEVGSGKSLVGELLAEQSQRLDNLYLTDSSPSMLSYSEFGTTLGAKLMLGNAEALSLPSDSIEVVVSSLGDPYNSPRFWMETDRLLKRGGLVLFTCPSYEWAEAFRGGSIDSSTCAEFQLTDGRQISIRSLIYSIDEQVRLIECHGLSVREITHATLCSLNGSHISPKLKVLQKSESSVVTGYLANKP